MRYLFVLFFALAFIYNSNSQCTGFPATIAENTCGTGTPLIPGGPNNINGGTAFNYCGTTSASPSYSQVNLNGGNLTICGNMTITGGTFNSGNLIVSCGSTVTFNNSLTLNSNIKIINYGRIVINGNLDFQNNGNCFYNETGNSSLSVSGNITWPQNTSDNSYLKNNGYVAVGGTLNARNGVYVCSGPGSIMEATSLIYGTNCGAPANRFTFNGTGTSVLRLTGSSVLQGTVTASSSYAVNRGTLSAVVATCGSWGSAVVATNSPAFAIPSSPGPCAANVNGCFTALPIELVSFEAIADERIVNLYWATESEKNNDYFTVERSVDGVAWESISKVKSQGNGFELRHYKAADLSPLRGTSYYRLAQTDYDGTRIVSEIHSVVMRSGESFAVYPNPADEVINLLPAANRSFQKIILLDASGRVVFTRDFDDYSKGELFTLRSADFDSGVYFVHAVLSNGQQEIQRVIIK